MPHLKSPSSRLTTLPTYAFARLDELKAQAKAQGTELIDMGMGNPDMPTPAPIIEAIHRAVDDPANHRYPDFQGSLAFREAVANFMQRRYGVAINPVTEAQALIGAKEGIAHLSFAYSDEHSCNLVPDPYYPVHSRGTWLAGGNVVHLPLTAENGFLPDLDAIAQSDWQCARLLFLSYPNNPTSGVAPLDFYEKAVALAKQHGVIIVSDMAYAELGFDGYRPPSILQVPGAKDVAIEIHSFSKSFNMAGWRMGFAVGNAGVIKTLYSIKTNLDYGICTAIQAGGIYALNHAENFLPAIQATYQERRLVMTEGMRAMGASVSLSKAGIYLWPRIPAGYANSAAFCETLIEKTGVVFTPGSAFGTQGEGFFRISLVADVPRIEQALARIKTAGIRF